MQISNSKYQNYKSKCKFLKSLHSKFKFLFLICNFTFYILIFTFSCYAASPRQSVKAGNNLYQQKKLDEALQKYNEANTALPDSDIINFNMGAALYKKEDYQKALMSFTKALMSEDRKIEADALYNIGNCKYKLGKLNENTDLSSTVSLLRESLDYYKRAVEKDQKNKDARFNHEFVERELKALLDKLKTQPQDKEGKQGKQEQKQEQEKEQTAQAKEGEKEEKPQEEQNTDRQEEAKLAGEEKELSKQEARMLLERYGQEEAKPDYEDRRTRGYESEVVKDW